MESAIRKQTIYTVGCVQKVYFFVEENLRSLAYIGAAIAASELMIMYLGKKLETQILMQMQSRR